MFEETPHPSVVFPIHFSLSCICHVSQLSVLLASIETQFHKNRPQKDVLRFFFFLYSLYKVESSQTRLSKFSLLVMSHTEKMYFLQTVTA